MPVTTAESSDIFQQPMHLNGDKVSTARVLPSSPGGPLSRTSSSPSPSTQSERNSSFSSDSRSDRIDSIYLKRPTLPSLSFSTSASSFQSSTSSVSTESSSPQGSPRCNIGDLDSKRQDDDSSVREPTEISEAVMPLSSPRERLPR